MVRFTVSVRVSFLYRFTIFFVLVQGSADFLSRGPKNEMISLGGPQLFSKKKHSARFNIVLLHLRSKNDCQ